MILRATWQAVVAFGLGLALLLAGPNAAQAATSSAIGVTACDFSAPLPENKNGEAVANTTISGCGSYRWYITMQRHRFGPVWQNLADNFRDGDGDLGVRTGCQGSGWRTYRTVLTSSGGHQSISGHARFYC